MFQHLWNGKTTVSGLGGKGYHSIGCSFTKPLKKIAEDVKRRLLPAYRGDYFEYQREKNRIREKKASDMQKLEALTEASGGDLRDKYGSSQEPYNKRIDLEYESISQTYGDKYKLKIEASFGEALKIISFLREMDQS